MRLRRDPGQRPVVTPEQVEALERDLGSSIDAFRETLDERIGRADAERMPSLPGHPSDVAFPSINVDAAPWHDRPPSPVPVSATPAPPVAGSVANSPPAASPTIDAPAPVAHGPRLDATIDTARDFLAGLASELNARKPLIQRSFVVGSQCEIKGLRWVDGYIDYQDPQFETPAIPGSFTLHYKLAAPGATALFVDPSQTQATVEILLDHDLAFTLREGGDPASQNVFFNVNREIRGTLFFRPDHGRERVILEARHFEALGTRCYEIDPAAFDGTALEQLGAFLAGHRLRLPVAFVSSRTR